jgi:aryl-alcohol dehydrogenase-like predicted oxidoreductase
MDYRKLGNTGLKVSEIGLGCNNFGWWADEAASIAVANRAFDLGVNLFDTADMYDTGRSEEFLGKALKDKRHQVIIATKFCAPMGKGPNDGGGSRYYIMKAVEASLRRLQTDHIDLYQFHRPDPSTPIEETLRALDDLVHSGKVRYIGCSNLAAWQLSDALWTSRLYNLASFVTNQVRYNLFMRQVEAELVPCCLAHGVGIIPWGPLQGGFLTGKYRQGEKAPADSRLSKPMALYDGVISDVNYSRVVKLEAFAKERGHTVAELALAWLLSRPYVPTVIPGAKKPEQVNANVAASGWKLTAEDVAKIEAI